MLRPSITIASALLAVGLLFLSDARPSSADAPGDETGQQSTPRPSSFPEKHPKFASAIAQMVKALEGASYGETGPAGPVPQAYGEAAAAGSAPQPYVEAHLDAGLMQMDPEARLQVYIHLSAVDDSNVAVLQSLGVVVEVLHEPRGLVQAVGPVGSLTAIAGLDFVTAVTLPRYGNLDVGSKLTEGDALLGFDALRSAFGVDGSGVTVGVISDGIAGLSSAVGSGDLPATTLSRNGGGVLVSTSGGVIATSFRADGDLEAGLGVPTGAEGTAILEIVHDIAPGAQLRFANFGTDVEFNAAVDFLAANSDVVIDDLSFFGKPQDQTSDVSVNTSDALNSPANPIRGYYTSVGNYALRHYQAAFESGGMCLALGDGSTCHLFTAPSGYSDALSIGSSAGNRVSVPNGGTVVVYLSWDDVFGAATTDYDLFLVDTVTLLTVAVGGDDNTSGARQPFEFVVFTNDTGAARFYDVVITNFKGVQPVHNLELFVFGSSAHANGTLINFNTVDSSVPAQSDAGGGVVSVGAISASDPGADTIESFSSRGPTNNGATKPDFTAIDGVSVTGSGGFPSKFFGTSAAAPHAAGLAALLLEIRPDLLSGEPGDDPVADRVALRNAVITTAVDLGVGGVDNTYGYGRASGANASSSFLPGPPTNVTAVPGVEQATVSWTAPASDGGSPVTQYTVVSSPDALSAVVDGLTLSATVTGLTSGKSYAFTVTAANAVGAGSPSAVSNAVAPVPPPTPTPVPVPSLSAWILVAMALVLGGLVARRAYPVGRRGSTSVRMP